MKKAFRILNVFVEGGRFTGNPLCVFEDGRGLDDATLQAIALQMNLSETTFLFPSDREGACARARIFTPSYEMPFAGHPTLGTAHVARELLGARDEVVLDLPAGLIPVRATGDRWELRANAPTSRAAASRADLAEMLSLTIDDLAGEPLWIDTGSEQLVIPLASVDAVERARPLTPLLLKHGSNARRQGLAYVFAWRPDGDVHARFFFDKGGSVIEDPGTGSACANLGGYLVTTGADRSRALTVYQGARTGRPCKLGLRVDADDRVFVSGDVVELGRGELSI